MESFEEGLKLRILEMCAHREMENPDFSCAQECSNDRVPSQHSTSPFIKGWGYIGCPNSYNTH